VAPPASAAKTVEQFIFRTDQRQKMKVIKQLVEDEGVKNAFIFCNRKKDVDAVAKWLEGQGLSAEALHGDMPQKSRYEKLDAFKAGDIRLLVCSDVAARGLDVEAVSHVFNYDIPMNADDYVHRIGRTGRAGKTGVSISFASEDDAFSLPAIESYISQKLKTAVPDEALMAGMDKPPITRKRGGRRPPQGSRNQSGRSGGQRQRR